MGGERGCTFCGIVRGEVTSATVHEDEVCVGFLDHRPLFPGHVLLVPRAHVEALPELPPQQLEPFFRIVQRLCEAVPSAVDAEGTFVAVNNQVSQSVPHLHVHVVPRSRGDGLRGFFWPRNPYRDEQHLKDVQAAVRRALEDPGHKPCPGT